MKLSTLAREIADKMISWHETRETYEADLLKAYRAYEAGKDPDDLFDDCDDPDSAYLAPDFFAGCESGKYALNWRSTCVENTQDGCPIVDSYLEGYNENDDRTLDSLVSEYFNYISDFDKLAKAIESDLTDLAVDLHQELDDPDIGLVQCKLFLADYLWLDDLLLYTQRDLSGADLVDAFLRQ